MGRTLHISALSFLLRSRYLATKTWVLPVIWVLGLSNFLNAQIQPGIPFLKNYEVEDYQEGTNNWAITQAENGLIYVGNHFGVLQFDGLEWTKIPLTQKSIPRSMQWGPDGKLYVGGQGEIGSLDLLPDGQPVFTSFDSLLPEQNRDFDDVWKTLAIGDSIIFQSENLLLVYFQGSVEELPLPEQGNGLRSAFTVRNKLWIQDGLGRVFALNGNTWKTIDGLDLLRPQMVETVKEWGQDRLLIICEQGDFFIFENGLRPFNTPLTRFVRDYGFESALLLSDGHLALGSRDNGMVIASPEGEVVSHINREKGLINNTVRDICEDHNGDLWLALDYGLAHMSRSIPFSRIPMSDGIQGTPYTSLLEDDILYLGTSNGVFYMGWEELTNPMANMHFEQVIGSEGQVYAIERHRGHLLIGHNRGAFEIINGRAYPIFKNKGYWTFLPVPGRPNFLIGGTYRGLDLLKLVEGKWQFQRHLEGWEESSRVMAFADQSNLWVCHGNKGLFRLRLSPDFDILETKFYGQEDGFPSDIFINVFEIGDELIFTGEYGAFRYNFEKDTFETFDLLEDLFSDSTHIRMLQESSQGRIWYQAGEEFGLLKVTDLTLDKAVKKYPLEYLNGRLLPAFEHVNELDEDFTLVGTYKEFILIKSAFRPSKSEEFDCYISRLEGLGSDKKTIIRGPGARIQGKDLSIPFNENSLRFSYAANVFGVAGPAWFSTYLEGFDSDWSEYTSQHRRELTNLHPGTYRFHVRALDRFGRSSHNKVVEFEVLTPWYRQTWAIILEVALGLLVIAGLLFWWTQRVAQKKDQQIMREKQKMLIKEKAFEEENYKKSEEIMRLKNEKLRAEIAHKNRELTSSTMHLVQQGETLQKIREELKVLEPKLDRDKKKNLGKIIRYIDDDLRLEKNWEQFVTHFDNVHQDFLKKLSKEYPNLTPKDLKLCAYLRLNLNTKEIAPLLNISVRGVEISRYRLRKKLDLETGDNLTEFLMNI